MNKKIIVGLTGVVLGLGGTITTAILAKKNKKVASKISGAIAVGAAVTAAAMGVSVIGDDEEEYEQYTANFDNDSNTEEYGDDYYNEYNDENEASYEEHNEEETSYEGQEEYNENENVEE